MISVAYLWLVRGMGARRGFDRLFWPRNAWRAKEAAKRFDYASLDGSPIQILASNLRIVTTATAATCLEYPIATRVECHLVSLDTDCGEHRVLGLMWMF